MFDPRICGLLVALFLADTAPVAAQPKLDVALELNNVSNAVTATPDGTFFVGFPHVMGEPGLRVAKIVSGKPVRFPDEGWNNWKRGADPTHAFVRFNSMRIGPDGKLWIVDVGSPAIYSDQLEVPPDGKYVYYMPSSGPLYRVAASNLTDLSLSDADLEKRTKLFAKVETAGGTAIDADGNLYVSRP